MQNAAVMRGLTAMVLAASLPQSKVTEPESTSAGSAARPSRFQRAAITGDPALHHAIGADHAGDHGDVAMTPRDQVRRRVERGLLVADAEAVEMIVVDVGVDQQRRQVARLELLVERLLVHA